VVERWRPVKVAVVTPYYQEPLEWLLKTHESVLAQSYACRHVLVADGFPRKELSGWDVDHVLLPKAHGDIGSTPRLIGAYHAIGLGFNAIAFLDADNWYAPDHIAGLVKLAQSVDAGFVSSGRWLCRIDGSLMKVCPNTNPDLFIDTNCMMFMRSAFPLLAQWVLMPSYGHVIGDRIMYHAVRQSGVRRAHSENPTVFYRCSKAGIYRVLGEPIPPGVVEPPNYSVAFRRWVEDGNPPLNKKISEK